MHANKLAQLAIHSNFILLLLSNKESLYPIEEQRTRIQVQVTDPKLFFTNAKVEKFIKLFDKALPGSHKVTICNDQTDKLLQILRQLPIGIYIG